MSLEYYMSSSKGQILARAPSVGTYVDDRSQMFVTTRTSALYPSVQQYHSNRDSQKLQCHLVAALVLLFDSGVIEISAGSHPTLDSALAISTEWSE